MKANWIVGGLALVLVGAFGAAQGRLTDRWGMPHDVIAAAERLQRIPMNFGEWQGVEGERMSDRTQQAAGAVGYLTRTYTNARGRSVSLMILCGRPGPISSHSPTVCFTGGGNVQEAPKEAVTINYGTNGVAGFFYAVFNPPATRPGPGIDTLWGCSTNGSNWEAVDDGRIKYAREPHLYRTFVTSVEDPTLEADDKRLNEIFLSEFLPIVARCLADEAPDAAAPVAAAP